MPRSIKTVKVEAVPGESMVYRVESWGEPDMPHTVVLLERQGNGVCTCKDFRTTCQRNWKNGEGKKVHYGFPGRPDKKRTQCRHIYCTRIRFLDDLLTSMSPKSNDT